MDYVFCCNRVEYFAFFNSVIIWEDLDWFPPLFYFLLIILQSLIYVIKNILKMEIVVIKKGNKEITRSEKINKDEAGKMISSLQTMFNNGMPYRAEMIEEV